MNPTHFWCNECDAWTRVRGNAKDFYCERCGFDYVCGECGYDISRSGTCQRPEGLEVTA